jgi:hypothetical protein
MSRYLICQLIVILYFEILVISGLEKSSKFQLFNEGKIPTAGFWQIELTDTTVVRACAEKCLSLSDSASCGGFVYQPDSCGGNNSSATKSGKCRLVQFINIALVSFGPTTTSCQKFYLTSPVRGELTWFSRGTVVLSVTCLQYHPQWCAFLD